MAKHKKKRGYERISEMFQTNMSQQKVDSEEAMASGFNYQVRPTNRKKMIRTEDGEFIELVYIPSEERWVRAESLYKGNTRTRRKRGTFGSARRASPTSGSSPQSPRPQTANELMAQLQQRAVAQEKEKGEQEILRQRAERLRRERAEREREERRQILLNTPPGEPIPPKPGMVYVSGGERYMAKREKARKEQKKTFHVRGRYRSDNEPKAADYNWSSGWRIPWRR